MLPMRYGAELEVKKNNYTQGLQLSIACRKLLITQGMGKKGKQFLSNVAIKILIGIIKLSKTAASDLKSETFKLLNLKKSVEG